MADTGVLSPLDNLCHISRCRSFNSLQ